MAEVMKYDDLKEAGTDAAVKAAGKYMQKGKEYVVDDGDIIYFKVKIDEENSKWSYITILTKLMLFLYSSTSLPPPRRNRLINIPLHLLPTRLFFLSLQYAGFIQY